MQPPGKAILLLWLITLCSPAQLKAGTSEPAKSAANNSQHPGPQTACPVMGGPIDKTLYVDVKGKRIYLCCAACEEAVRTEPDKYIAKIQQRGQIVADAPTHE